MWENERWKFIASGKVKLSKTQDSFMTFPVLNQNYLEVRVGDH